MSEILEKNKAPRLSNDTEIDLIEIFHILWEARRKIYVTATIFIVIGFIIVLSTPKKFKSEVTLLVEAEAKGGMSGLLQQFGVNLGSAKGDALIPELYPEVVKSLPFLLNLLNQRVTESKYDSTMTLANYLDRHTKKSALDIVFNYTFGLPGKIKDLIKGKQANESVSGAKQPSHLKLTQKYLDLAKQLTECIKADGGDVKKRTLLISVEMQDPNVAAEVVDSVVVSLSRYIIDYRTQKAKTDLKFISERYAESEMRYLKAQKALANFRDQNKNIVLATARSEEERLLGEFNLSFSVYNGLSQQLEQAKIKVQENTPMFKVLSPAFVPLEKSKPNTTFTIVLLAILGIIFQSSIIIGKIIYIKIKSRLT